MIKKQNLYYPSKELKQKAWVKDKKIYKQALKNPVKFWENLASELFWFKKWKKAFVHKPPYFQWFVNGKINITSNIFENNSLGWENIKNKVAIFWEPEPIDETPKVYTYYELFRQVNYFANGLKKMGVKKGDIVGIYLPMIPEVIIAMLACARIGAVHSIVFSAFSSNALKIRLQDTKAKVLITADGYYRRGKVVDLKKSADQAIKDTKVKKVIVAQRANNKINMESKRDFWWNDLIKNQSDYSASEIMDSEDPFFILYTSGSTGKPKGTIQTCGGYAVQAKFTGKWIFDWRKDDIFWSTADVGWITGHTYSVYSNLLNGVSSVFFEGAVNFPEPDRWAKIIEKYGVTIFYTAPTAIRMFKTYGTKILKKYKFNNLRILGSVGEPIDQSAWQWYSKEIGKEKCVIVDTWWQTETGGILLSSLPGVGAFKPCFAGLPFPGIKFDIFNAKGKSCKNNEQGDLVILPPFSPGLLRGIYKNPEKYLKTYFTEYGKNIYFTSDSAFRDENGLIRIVGRTDDVIKVAGHRFTTGEIESAVSHLTNVSECAVIGIPDKIKGEVLIIFAVLKNKVFGDKSKKEIVSCVRNDIGPIATPKEIYLVDDLPKTRSGKIMRRILKRLLAKEKLGDLSTIANPESVKNIKSVLML